MSMHGKNHHNIVISLQLKQVNFLKKKEKTKTNQKKHFCANTFVQIAFFS